MSLEGFARLRLQEEMGFDTPLYKMFDFIYKADMGNGLIEYEFDHVLMGNYSGPVFPDSAEVMEYKYLSVEQIGDSLDKFPDMYTSWFRMAIPRVKKWQQVHSGDKEE